MKVAICHLLDGHGCKVERDGKSIEFCRDLPDLPPDELKAWAKSEGLKFVRWYGENWELLTEEFEIKEK